MSVSVPWVAGRAELHPAGDPAAPYRLSLYRGWDPTRPPMVWVMLNPSTADARVNDPTIRKCIGFAQRLGFGAIEVVNLFALRSTDPDALTRSAAAGVDIIGPGNDDAILAAAARTEPGGIYCAWGSHKAAQANGRARHVLNLLPRQPVFALRISKTGTPWHPLYVPYSAMPVEFARERLGVAS